MRGKTKTVGGVVGTGAVALMGWAGAAFGCTASPQVSYSLLPESATPGQTVTVEGRSVSSGSPVEIRWNGVKGDVLATATPSNGAFSVPVKVPAVPQGVYSLMLVTSDAGVGRTAIEVTSLRGAAEQTVAAPKLWPTESAARAGLQPASSGGPSSLGVGLLAVGLIGLFAGSSVAAVRRRRVVAGTRL